MKRVSTIITLSIVCVISVMAQIDTININRLEIKGNVATVTEYTYTVSLNKAGKIIKRSITDKTFEIDEEKRESNYSYAFDSLRQETKYVTYYSSGNIKKEKFYNYSNGRVISTKAIYHFSDATPVVEEKYDYNDKGLLSLCKAYRDGGLLYTEKFAYDDRQNLVEKKETKWNGERGDLERYVREYEGDREVYCKKYKEHVIDGNVDLATTNEERMYYNAKGILVRKYVNADNVIINDSHYLYNGNGKIDSIYVLGFARKFLWTEKYRYDKFNRIVSQDLKQTDGGYQKKQYFYSENEKIEKIIGKQDGITINRMYVYNDKNLITKYTTGNITYKYVYQCDVKGNWTKIVEYKNNRPTLIRERKISYHD